MVRDDECVLTELPIGTLIDGETYFIGNVAFRPFSGGAKEYVIGKMRNKASEFTYKSFDADVVQAFKNTTYTNKLAVLDGKVEHYNGEKYLKVTQVKLSMDTDTSLYIKSLDYEGLFTELITFINSGALSQQAVVILVELFKHPRWNLMQTVKIAYAAKAYHDNIRGGLLHHTIKGLRILQTLVQNDSRLAEYADLLYVGWICHDLGKTLEIEDGVYSKIGFVTHITLAIEMITTLRDVILTQKGEDWYYRLLSCIDGHHGKYGAPPNTIYAYILHYVDMLESRTTTIMDAVAGQSLQTGDNNMRFLWQDDFRLHI
jgi:3'-5' exoribonuclease